MARVGQVVVVGFVVLAASCGDDSTQPGEDGSTSDTGTVTSSTSTSTTVDTATDTSSESTGTGGTDTGSDADGRARLIYTRRLDVERDPQFELWTVDYENGRASAPVLLHPPLGPGESINTLLATSADRRFVAFVAYGSPSPRLFVVDVTSPAFPDPIEIVPPVATPEAIASPAFAPANHVLTFVATNGTDPAYELYGVDLDVDSGNVVKLSPALDPGGSVSPTVEFAPDGSRVGYAADIAGSGTDTLYVQTLDLDTAPAPVEVATPANTLQWWSPDGDSAMFTLDIDMDGIGEHHLVDLAGAPAMVDVHDAADMGDVRATRIAPDGRAMIYLSSAEGALYGDLWLVPLVGATFGTPVLVSTMGSEEAYSKDTYFSPDSSRIAYIAIHGGPLESWVVELDGTTPTPAVRANDDLIADGEVRMHRFAPGGVWLDYFARQDQPAVELYRTSFANLGSSTKLNGPIEGPVGLSTELTYNDDGSAILFTGVAELDGPQNLYWVDLSQRPPAAAVQLNAPLGPAGDVNFGAEFAPDLSVVFFAAREELDGAMTLRAVPLDAPGNEVVLHDAGDVLSIRIFDLP